MKNRWSLRGKLVLLSCVIALAVAGVSYGVYAYSVLQMARNSVFDNLRSLQSEVENNLASDLGAIDRAAKNIIVGNTVYRYLQSGAPALSGDVLAQSVLRTGIEKDMTYDLLFDAAFSAGLIENVHLYLTEDNVAFLSRNNRSTDKCMSTVQAIYEGMRQERFWGMRCYPSGPEDPLVYFAYCLYPLSTDGANRNLYLIFSTAKARLYERFAPLRSNDGALFFVTDEKGRAIVLSAREAEGVKADCAVAIADTGGAFVQMQHAGQSYFASACALGNGFRSVTLLPVTRLTAGVRNATWQYLILCMAVLCFTILLVLPLALRLTHFANDIVDGIRRFGGGDFAVKLPAYRDRDLNEVSRTFNQMTAEINTLIRDRYEKQMLIQQMDISFLQSQMNPHFLFNVLLTLSARAKMAHDELLFEMVQSLTTLLQASLHQKHAVKIPFRQELEYVRAYLNIQRLRFGSRISFDIGVPEALQGLLIPRLSVQPLVENAVLHGLAPREESGCVRVHAAVDGGALLITVADDGCGFTPGSPPAPDAGGGHNHIALENLRKRIELIYGGGYALTVASAPGEGCRVSLRLPREEEPSGELPCDFGG